MSKNCLFDRNKINSSKWNGHGDLTKEGLVPFSVADMEYNNCPILIDDLKKRVEIGYLGYTVAKEEYFNSIVSWMNKRHDWYINKNDILTTPSVLSSLSIILSALAKKGEGVVVFTPAYPPFISTVNNLELELVAIPLLANRMRYTIDWEKFESEAKNPNTKFLIFCSPHNPVSRVWTNDELVRLNNICVDNNIQIISDEIHLDLVLKGYNHIPLAKINNNTITCTSITKTFNLAGIKISNIICQNANTKLCIEKEMAKYWTSEVNLLGYEAVISAYNKCEDWLDSILEQVSDNYRYITNFIKTNDLKIEYSEMEGTYLLWLDFSSYDCDKLFIEFSRKHLIFNQGNTFCANSKNMLRMNIAAPSETIEKAWSIIKSVILEM